MKIALTLKSLTYLFILYLCFGVLFNSVKAQNNTIGSTPQELNASDWNKVKTQIDIHKHAIQAIDPCNYYTVNTANGFNINFKEDGQTLIHSNNKNTSHYIGFKLKGIGYKTINSLSSPIDIEANKNQLTYQWNTNIKEWWINEPGKLEQWFSINERPLQTNKDDKLKVQLALDTDLNISQKGNTLYFKNTNLKYDKLKVWDANGVVLTAGMEYENNTINLVIDDAQATYPITIDPIIAQTAYIKASNTNANDWFENAVAISGNTMVVGANTESSNATGINGNQLDDSALAAGAVYVFEESQMTPCLTYGSAWDVSTANYNGTQFSITLEETKPYDLFFKPDGSRMFVMGYEDDAVVEYDLSTPWDVSTATYDPFAGEFYVGAIEPDPQSLFFKPDGTSIFIAGGTGNVSEYNLSTPWDVSTANFILPIRTFYVGLFTFAPTDIDFKPDGSRMFIIDELTQIITEYDLSTPWDISTASYNGFSEEFSVAAQEIEPRGFIFKPDGSRMFVIGTSGKAVVEYDLATPWDVSTASYNGTTFNVSSQEIAPFGLFFKPDGTRLFVTGHQINSVIEYDLGLNTFTESNPANDGSITAGEEVAISIDNDTFTNAGGTLTHGVDYTITNLPTGLIPNLAIAADGTTATLTLGGNALPGTHYDSDDIASLQFTWAASAFSGGVPPTQACDGGSLTDSGIGINFFGELPCITYGAPWDVSEAIYNGASEEFYIGDETGNNPNDIFFTPDGTRMFATSSDNDAIIEYDLSTAWDVSTASYNGASEEFYLGGQETSPRSLFFKPDGTRMFVLGSDGDAVVEYDLSTPWDVSTASYNGTGEEFYIGGQSVNAYDFFFKPDGTRLFINDFHDDSLVEYDLSSPWDVSTASYNGAGEEFNYSANTAYGYSMYITPNGSRMFLLDAGDDSVNEYDLSTPWDVSTASYNGAAEEYYVGGETLYVSDLFFKSNGTRMYVISYNDLAISEYDLGLNTFTESNPANDGSITAGEEAIITIENDTFTNAGGTLTHGVDYTITNLPAGLVPNLAIAADGSTATLTLSGNATNHQGVDDVASLLFSWAASAFSGGVPPTQTCDGGSLADSGIGIDFEDNPLPCITYRSAWDVSEVIYNGIAEEFNVGTQEFTPVDLFFKPDGTRMFIIGYTDDAVVEYDLTTPWDVSTATYNGIAEEFDVRAQESSPTAQFFKPDGTRMFIIGTSGDAVVEYDLTTPWDVSTAVYNGAAEEFGSQTSNPNDLFFKPDGTRMFIIADFNNSIAEYDLATPWDVSTAVYNGAAEEFSVVAQESVPVNLFFKPDGTRLFVVGLGGDAVVEYDLTTPWDVSTAVYNGIVEEFYAGAQDSSPTSLFFKPDGTRLFILGNAGDAVVEYDYPFTESNPANDGSITAGEEAIITIENDTFTNAGGTLTHGVDYTITNLPAGLVPNLAIAADGLTATLTLSGNATNHQGVDDVASLLFSWAASAFSGGVAPTQTCDGGSLADSGFGVDFEENPKDLTVLIRISDGEAIGVEQQILFVELNELLGNPTDDNIDIVVKITKDSRFMTNYDPILTNVTINGTPETVNNADWSFDNSDPSYYIFTNTGVINANGNSSFALSGMFLPDIPVGTVTFTVEITPNSGGDSVTTNNTDADTLNFFQIGRTR